MLGSIKHLLIAASIGVIASPTFAAVVVSYNPDATTFDGAPVVNTAGSASAAVSTTFTTNQGVAASTGIVSQTFVPTSSFKIDKIEVYLAGSASTGVKLHLYANPSGGSDTDGFVNVNGLTDLLGGGAGLTFDYVGTTTQNYAVLDLTGVDEVNLTSGTRYALEIGGGSASFFIRRAGSNPYTPGNLYTGTTDTSVSRTDVSSSGRRDAAVAVYATPEPASLALLALGGFAALRRHRA